MQLHQGLQMVIRVGILGLPNVGKSTLFNSLVQKSIAAAANFPFCTMDASTAPVPIPCQYLEPLMALEQGAREKCIAATIEFVDVAGLVKGAHRGEGLGNRFLATLRECHVLVHVVRTFPGGVAVEEVIHVNGKVDPVSDVNDIHLELLFADLDHVHRRLEKTACTGTERIALEKVQHGLECDIPARSLGLCSEEVYAIKSMGLLTLKPVLYAFNVEEVDFTLARVAALHQAATVVQSIPYFDPSTDGFTIVSAKLEAEITTSKTKDEHQRS